MRDPNRIRPIINLVYEYWMLHPDYRFGQMIQNLIDQASQVGDFTNIWFPEDNNWEMWLQAVLTPSPKD